MPENMLIIEADCVEYRKNLEIRAKTIRAKKKQTQPKCGREWVVGEVRYRIDTGKILVLLLCVFE